MSVSWGAGLHARDGAPLDASAYWNYVGRWSQLFVPSLLDAARVEPGKRVLDVATGSGEAALLAVSRVREAGFVVGADISLPMLSAARGRVTGATFGAVLVDAHSLAFEDGCFDSVLCQLGLMFFPDPHQALLEMRRVVRRDGRVAACVVSSADRAPMWGVLAECLSQRLPEQARGLQLSFALADASRFQGMFAAVGLRDVRVERHSREAAIASFDEYWAPIELGAGQLPQAYLALPSADRHAVRDEVRARLSQYEVDGRLVMRVEMLIASGCA